MKIKLNNKKTIKQKQKNKLTQLNILALFFTVSFETIRALIRLSIPTPVGSIKRQITEDILDCHLLLFHSWFVIANPFIQLLVWNVHFPETPTRFVYRNPQKKHSCLRSAIEIPKIPLVGSKVDIPDISRKKKCF